MNSSTGILVVLGTIGLWWLAGLLPIARLAQLSIRLQRAAFKRLRWAMPPQATAARLFWFAVCRNGVMSFVLAPLVGWYWWLRPRSTRRMFLAYGAMASFRLDKPIGDDIDTLCRVVWGWENGWKPLGD
jgi:hypothetical protein